MKQDRRRDSIPYILQEDRLKFDGAVDELIYEVNNEGDLNYVISRLANGFIQKSGGRYAHHNAVIGALDCAKMELYRRRTAPYEDTKIEANGDVE